MSKSPLTRTAAAGVLLAALSLSGCGIGQTTGQVSGQVQFQGKAVPAGTVKFVGADSKEVMAAVKNDGSYRVSGLLAGTYRVGFTPQAQNPFAPQGAGAVEKPLAIPRRYRDPATSGLECVVTGGQQEFPIDLKP
jgi:hypothetical protein